jgi:hypothetical protein
MDNAQLQVTHASCRPGEMDVMVSTTNLSQIALAAAGKAWWGKRRAG